MEVIGVLILIVLGFIFFGLLGKLIGFLFTIIGWLFNGVINSLGCLFWFIILLCLFICL